MKLDVKEEYTLTVSRDELTAMMITLGCTVSDEYVNSNRKDLAKVGEELYMQIHAQLNRGPKA